MTPRRGRGHPGSTGETEAARPAPREPRSCGRSRARHGRARWASAPPLVRRQSPSPANIHDEIAGFPAHERIAYHKSPHPKRLKRSPGTKAPLAWADGPATQAGEGPEIPHGRAGRAFFDSVRISGPSWVMA